MVEYCSQQIHKKVPVKKRNSIKTFIFIIIIIIIIIIACCTSRCIRLSHCPPNPPCQVLPPWPNFSSSTPPCLSLSYNSPSASGLWSPSCPSNFWCPPQCHKKVRFSVSVKLTHHFLWEPNLTCTVNSERSSLAICSSLLEVMVLNHCLLTFQPLTVTSIISPYKTFPGKNVKFKRTKEMITI